MRLLGRIDAAGRLVEDVLAEDDGRIPAGCVEQPVPEGFYQPRWNGSEWEDANPKTAGEKLTEAKAGKVREIRGRAEEETARVIPLYEILYLARNRLNDSRLTTIDNIAKRGRDLEAAVGKATTMSELEAISWE